MATTTSATVIPADRPTLNRRNMSEEDGGGWGHFDHGEGTYEAETAKKATVSTTSTSVISSARGDRGSIASIAQEFGTPIRSVSVQTAPPPSMTASASGTRIYPRDETSATSCPDFGSLSAARSRVSTSGITFSEAKGEIWKERLKGPLLKQGFRHRKQWVARWVVLSGRMLTYFVRPQDETPDYKNARGSLELTADTVVAYEHNDEVFGFVILPLGDKKRSGNVSAGNGTPSSSAHADLLPISRTDDDDSNGGSLLTCGIGGRSNKKRKQKNLQQQQESKSWWSTLFSGGARNPQEEVWCFRARSESEREVWVRTIQRVVALIRRVEMAPTLVGVGSIGFHYELQHDVGTGRFGTVKLAVAKATGNFFAVKVLDKAKFAQSPELSNALNMEIRVMRKVTRHHDHPNICKTYHSFADDAHVYLVMEYLAGGALQQRIDRRGPYSERDAANIILQVASALKELHASGIVLCDLSPANLLYESEGSETIKVVEFGRALIMPGPAFASQTRLAVAAISNHHQQTVTEHQQQGNSANPSLEDVSGAAPNRQLQPALRRKPPSLTVLSSFVTNQQIFGSSGYIAPEIYSHKQYSAACDVYALGCIVYTMLVGSPPFSGPDAVKNALKGMPVQPLLDADVSAPARALIDQMTNPDRTKRLTAGQVLEHPWVSLAKHPQPLFLSPSILKKSPSFKLLPTRRKWKAVITLVQFIQRLWLLSKRTREVLEKSGERVVKAVPPPPLSFNLLESRRSTETSSGISQLELRNQWLTLDGFAQRIRSENRLDESSPFFRVGEPSRANSTASGFTAVGISSSVAGQLSELGETVVPVGADASSKEPVRPAGPFLSALEAHLEAEAGLLTSSTEEEEEEDDGDEDEDDELDDEHVKSVGSNPQGPSKFDQQQLHHTQQKEQQRTTGNGSASSGVVSPNKPATGASNGSGVSRVRFGLLYRGDEDEDEEEEVPMSPKTSRATAVRMLAELGRESQNDAAETDGKLVANASKGH